MRIAINTLSLYKTKVGMGKYIVELVNRVPKTDTQNEYIIYLSKENEAYFDLCASNIKIKKVPRIFTYPFVKIIWEQLFLPFSMIKNNIDLYHATGFVLPLWKPTGIKFVVTIADMTFFTHKQYHTWFKKKYFSALIPASLKKADKIFAISENTKKDIIAMAKTNSEKIVTTYLGVDPIFMPKKKEEYLPVLAKYNLEQPYILYVGMLEPRKNIVGLIRAFSLLRKERKIKLVIIGKKGWMYDEIFSLVKSLHLEEKIIFTGYVPDDVLPAIYNAATCFVYPSFYEGFGFPVIEAMACGCPVITSNNSSLKEITGDAAILIDPENVNQIAEKIELILGSQEEREKRKKAGLKQAKKFKWDAFARKTREVYKNL